MLRHALKSAAVNRGRGLASIPMRRNEKSVAAPIAFNAPAPHSFFV